MLKGWECPKCGRVFAPQVEECKYCNNLSHEMVTNLGNIPPPSSPSIPGYVQQHLKLNNLYDYKRSESSTIPVYIWN